MKKLILFLMLLVTSTVRADTVQQWARRVAESTFRGVALEGNSWECPTQASLSYMDFVRKLAQTETCTQDIKSEPNGKVEVYTRCNSVAFEGSLRTISVGYASLVFETSTMNATFYFGYRIGVHSLRAGVFRSKWIEISKKDVDCAYSGKIE